MKYKWIILFPLIAFSWKGPLGDAFVLPAANEKTDTTDRLRQLRGQMTTHNIAAYIIPAVDQHMSEYVALADMRKLYMSGFSGSAGIAVVTMNKAALWTDGRYYTQAEMQLDGNWKLMKTDDQDTPKIPQWLITELAAKSKVGIDPSLVSINDFGNYEKSLAKGNLTIEPVTPNLVDEIWTDRPSLPRNPVFVLTINYTGKSWSDKVNDVRAKMKAKQATGVVFHKLDDEAWLLNLRGSDIESNPMFFAFCIVTMDDVILFIDDKKITPSVRKHLRLDSCGAGEVCAQVKPYDKIIDGIKNQTKVSGAKIWVSPYASYALIMHISKDQLLSEASPAVLAKSIKNPTEIQGMRNANIRDGVAMCEFFAWMEKEVPKGRKDLTEMSSSDKLEEFKSKQRDYVSDSFKSIVGYGANGAIIHYRPSNSTDKQIKTDSTYLVDSGGQYRDGTTDTTRTLHFGTPSYAQKDAYTRILKGEIQLATSIYPNKTQGRFLDVFARQELWKNGLDYKHGTGHGIGMFLNVHEGPQRINYGCPKPWERPMAAGMFTSDEPGFYKVGEFGIRLETVVLTIPAETENNFDGNQFLTFEAIALVPYEIKLINLDLLTPKEIKWLNDYHKTTREKVGAEMKKQGKNELYDWLVEKTEPIKMKDVGNGASLIAYSAVNLFSGVLFLAMLLA